MCMHMFMCVFVCMRVYISKRSMLATKVASHFAF